MPAYKNGEEQKSISASVEAFLRIFIKPSLNKQLEIRVVCFFLLSNVCLLIGEVYKNW